MMFPAWSLICTLVPFIASHKVAIVGGGVGGTSTSYFLKHLFKGDTTNLQIKLFESGSDIGGRLKELKIGGKSYDSGGSIIHSSNFYAKTLTRIVGLKEEPISSSGSTVGFYDGSKFVLKLSGSTFKDKFKVLGRYGFGVKKLIDSVGKSLEDLNTIYCLQKHQIAFRSVTELLNSTHPDFLKKMHVDFKTDLTKDGVDKLIQDELITASLHANYNQDIENVNSFIGFTSLAGGFVGELWRVRDGNYQLPGQILRKSGVEHNLQTKVVKISRRDDGGYIISYTNTHKDGDLIEEEFDAVVIATPLHNADIQFENIPEENYQDAVQTPYQTTIATFVNGVLAPLVPGEENPLDILTVKSDSLLFSSIGTKGEGDQDTNYKVFSKTPLTEAQINKLFSKVNELKVVDWKAYPKYKAPTNKTHLPDFEIEPGLVYLNAIELASSAIEMSCIGAKNSALLVYHFLRKTSPQLQNESLCRDQKFDLSKYRDEL